jgi:DNA-binding transcriptional MerR regulator
LLILVEKSSLATAPGKASVALPPIPAKRYFTIGEVAELCAVKPYVLRYWEQEFTQLKPMKRRGNRRYYQHHEVLLIRRIRDLLYEQGFTISGARNRLADQGTALKAAAAVDLTGMPGDIDDDEADFLADEFLREASHPLEPRYQGASMRPLPGLTPEQLRLELLAVRRLLGV